MSCGTLNQPLRAALPAGAEEQSRRAHGRRLSDDQLGRSLAQGPGLVADNDAMAPDGPHPLFHGKQVRIDFSPFVRNPRIIAAQVYGLVLRMEDTGASEDELLIRIHERIAEHEGLVARLVSKTDEAIDFTVTHG